MKVYFYGIPKDLTEEEKRELLKMYGIETHEENEG